MKVAFYAPMKSPAHPVPSGDRLMARSLIDAMRHSGHIVDVACHLRARVGDGDRKRQQRLKVAGEWIADKLVAKYQSAPPDLWFTYHLYYKAPDWIGPSVAERLGIPYVAAEVSVAQKRAGGAWDLSHRAVVAAIARSHLIVSLNPVDEKCVALVAEPETHLISLSPFVAFRRRQEQQFARKALAERYALDPALPWLVTSAMMRPGSKFTSYQQLSQALNKITTPFQLIVAGDGPKANEVRALFSDQPAKFIGLLDQTALDQLYASSDILVWPGVDEAWGMVYLEAQAAGLPVVASRHGGVSSVIDEGVTGMIVDKDDVASFADAVNQLLRDPDRRESMGQAAEKYVRTHFDLPIAAEKLDAALQQVVS